MGQSASTVFKGGSEAGRGRLHREVSADVLLSCQRQLGPQHGIVEQPHHRIGKGGRVGSDDDIATVLQMHALDRRRRSHRGQSEGHIVIDLALHAGTETQWRQAHVAGREQFPQILDPPMEYDVGVGRAAAGDDRTLDARRSKTIPSSGSDAGGIGLLTVL